MLCTMTTILAQLDIFIMTVVRFGDCQDYVIYESVYSEIYIKSFSSNSW